MNTSAPTVSQYVADRVRDDAVIGNKKCPHGKLVSCGYPGCIARRARLLKAASKAGRR